MKPIYTTIICFILLSSVSFAQRKLRNHAIILEPSLSYSINSPNSFGYSFFISRYNTNNLSSFSNKLLYGAGIIYSHELGLSVGAEYNFKLLEIRSYLTIVLFEKNPGIYYTPAAGIGLHNHELHLLIGYNFLLNSPGSQENMSGPLITIGSRIFGSDRNK